MGWLAEYRETGTMNRLRGVLLVGLAVCTCAALARAAEPAAPKTLAAEIIAGAGVPGGLCVHLGCGDGSLTANLSAEGRFLVHGLDPDAAAVDAAARLIRSRGIYGQVWAEAYSGEHLPYTENLVNLVVADDPSRMSVPCAEIFRVLVPDGIAYIGQSAAAQAAKRLDVDGLKKRLADAGFAGIQVIERSGVWVRAKKSRPPEMDEWGQPRHGASGNAVSSDTLVGPPRRVRWIAGPMHESSNIVTAGGRFFYAGAIARDAFNGLRLWDRKLDPTPMRLGFPAAAVPGSALPVASGNRLYVVTGGKLAALDAATGESVREYPDAGTPKEILLEGKTLLAWDASTLKALNIESGKVLWTHAAVRLAGVVAGDGGVFCLDGETSKDGGRAVLRLDLATGKVVWRKADYPWAAKVQRLSYYKGLLACEVSTLSDTKPGNGMHLLAAGDGSQKWEYLYEPGQAHYQQGRPLQTETRVWVLSNGKWQGLDRGTGSVREEYKAGSNHCYPPVAAGSYLLGEEMSFTDMKTGEKVANRITKGNCGRDAGFVPANGLLYVAPKHCACYPMLKGYTAMAPAKRQGGKAAKEPTPADFVAERGPAFGAAGPAATAAAASGEWPSYRADMWRSASTAAPAPANPEVIWTAEIGDWPAVRSLQDWKENPWIRGPVTPPVVAGGTVFLAQPDGHRVLAFDAKTGKPQWDFTANGRVDTPPTIWDGLCLFGTSSGYVYCLRAADGKLVWRLRAGPEDERIVAFGQLESPWPVPGSVLIVNGTAYFAAGRQALADGGIRIFAADPGTGAVKTVKMITSLPHTSFYGGSGLEFDAFDLLVAENRPPAAMIAATSAAPAVPLPAARQGSAGNPDFVTMSRWQMDLATQAISVAWESGFGYYGSPGAAVFAPRGTWTYGQRMDYLASGPKPGAPDFVANKPRPLAAFHGNSIFCSSENKQQLFRRDFRDEPFNDKWFSQRQLPRKDAVGDRNRSERLAHGAAWQRDIFDGSDKGQGIGAMVLAGDTVFVAGTRGRLLALASADGKTLAECDLPAPVWDGMAAAYGRVYVSTHDGKLICLGKKE
jgi:outer membrane protein assembly factor BamB